MADNPTEWLVARIRIVVSKSDGGRASSYGWTLREIRIPTRPAMPDVVELEVVKNRRVTVKCRPLEWDADKQEYSLPDVTIVLTSADIAHLQAAAPAELHIFPPPGS